MGTNYYLKKSPFCKCPTCGQSRDEPELIHIGKSSGGWCFALHGIPGFAMSLKEWKPHLRTFPIVDEYNADIPFEEMLDTIVNRRWEVSQKDAEFPQYDIFDRTKIVYHNLGEFLQKNSAILGPRNLLRHARSTIHGGKVPWDIVEGEFS